MPRTCTVCTHPERAAIDQALIAGEAAQQIAARYCSLSRPAIQRHKAEHLPESMLRAKVADDISHALDIFKQLRAINAASLQVLDRARQSGDGELVLKSVDRIQRQIELQAKLRGELDERAHIDVVLTPAWLSARAALLAALQPFPEARVAVAQRLLSLEAATATGTPHGHSN
jgi:hypothetical protein